MQLKLLTDRFESFKSDRISFLITKITQDGVDDRKVLEDALYSGTIQDSVTNLIIVLNNFLLIF